MADATYINQGVYNKQGGNTKVIASGGKIEIESGGELEGQSGGSFDAQSGFNFYLGGDSTAIPAEDLLLMFRSFNTKTHWGTSGTAFSGTSIISPAYGFHFYSASTGISKASLALPSAYVGARLILDFSYCVNDANCSIFAESGGGFVSLYNYASVRLSSLEISAAGRMELVCFTDDVWSVVSDNGSVTERAAA